MYLQFMNRQRTEELGKLDHLTKGAKLPRFHSCTTEGPRLRSISYMRLTKRRKLIYCPNQVLAHLDISRSQENDLLAHDKVSKCFDALDTHNEISMFALPSKPHTHKEVREENGFSTAARV